MGVWQVRNTGKATGDAGMSTLNLGRRARGSLVGVPFELMAETRQIQTSQNDQVALRSIPIMSLHTAMSFEDARVSRDAAGVAVATIAPRALPAPASREERQALFATAKAHGVSVDDLRKIVERGTGQPTTETLTPNELALRRAAIEALRPDDAAR